MMRRRQTAPAAGHAVGPLQARAQRSLLTVAKQFGDVASDAVPEVGSGLSVDVTAAGGDWGDALRLSYGKGDFIFSRVYDLTISGTVQRPSRALCGPAAGDGDSRVALPLELSFTRHGSRLVPSTGAASADSAAAAGRSAQRINRRLQPLLREVDLKSLSITDASDGRCRIDLVPLGGAYVWILVPPVSMTVRFPPGEPARLLHIMSTIRAVLRGS